MATTAPTCLDADEAELVRLVLSKVVVEKRTGQIGIMHGADRFVSTQLVLKKDGRALLDKVARKLGLPGVVLVNRQRDNPPLHWTAAAERLPQFEWSLARPQPVNGNMLSFAPAMQLDERIISVGKSLDRLVIGELPAAIKLFWRLVGSVNFIGDHPKWDGGEYPDPIVVFPPVYALSELDEFLSDNERRLAHNFPYLVPIAPDALHKQNVSGGMWYNLSVPAVADDPPLNDERHRVSFVSYLELAVRWGGFPGLEQYPDHSYPLEALRGGPAGER